MVLAQPRHTKTLALIARAMNVTEISTNVQQLSQK